jgi:histidine triad (HIT) family protein
VQALPEECVFCRIASGEIPAKLVAETADCIAFRDMNPRAPVHTLVIPREHVASLNDVTDPDLVGKMMLLGAEIARRSGVAESGYRCVVNTNADAGQTVFHIHLHVLGGRTLEWPPG